MYDEKNGCKTLHYNWNRISMLMSKKNQSESQKKEISMRISLQNCFSCNNDYDARKEVIKAMEKTLTPEIKEEVDKYVYKMVSKL